LLEEKGDDKKSYESTFIKKLSTMSATKSLSWTAGLGEGFRVRCETLG
jgi:hypothetical protein